MKNQFGKTRPHDSPYAIYQGDGGFEWRILKTYRSVDNVKKDKYARWFVSATSYHMPEGEYEMGDTYVQDIIINGRGKLIDATPEWRDAYSH